MTSKHFRALAVALNSTRPDPTFDSRVLLQWNADMLAVANVCRSANSRFDAQRFIDACGGLFVVCG